MPSITDALTWFKNIVDDYYTGYSQDFRNGQKVTREQASGKFTYASNYLNDFTGDRYDATLTYYDCSSAVYYALKAGGWDVESVTSYPFTTKNNEISCLKSLGFYEVTGRKLKAGDVAWKLGHTAMVYEDSDSNNVKIYEAYGRNSGGYVQFENQVRSSTRNDFTNFYRSDDGEVYTPVDVNLYVISAIAGNFRAESQINPGIWESLTQCSWTTVFYTDSAGNGCGGYGLGQWTNTNGDTHGRLYQLYQWLTGKGFSADSGDGQVAYIFYEKTWNRSSDIGKEYNYGYTSFDEFVQSDSTNIEELTHAWNACWEGIKNSSWDERVEYANDAYDYISEHKDDSDITDWIVGNRYLSVNEMHNNMVMLYRAFYNQFNEVGYEVHSGEGSIGDNGQPNTNDDNSVSFTDFLYSMLSSKNNDAKNIHIIKGDKK